MAIKTVSNTGGVWNVTTTWTDNIVPVAGDTVVFTSTSGNLTVNVPTANLAGIDFTNYVGTITFTSAINTSGTVNLGTGDYTQAGASGLVINGTSTISGSATWSRTLTFTGTSITYTLGNDLNVTGTISLSGTTTSVFNGNTLNIGGNLTVTTLATVSGTTAFVFNGTGTWSHTGSGGYIQNNVTINTAGTLTLGTNIYYQTGTLTYTSGTVTTTGNTLNMISSCTLNTNGINWNNVTFSNSTVITITLLSNFNISGNTTLANSNGTINFSAGANLFNPTGNLIISAGGTSTINLPNNINIVNLTMSGTIFNLNLNTVSISGNLTMTGNGVLQGTSLLKLTGTGSWTTPNAGDGVRLVNNLTIDTLGTITLPNYVIYGYSSTGGTITYLNGTVITTNSTLVIEGGVCTLNTSGISWGNVTVTAGTPTITLTSDLNLNNNLTISTHLSSTCTINGLFNVNVGGNLAVNNPCTGTSNILLNGTGSQSWTHGSAVYLSNNLTINKASGTLTIGANVYYRTGTLTYTTGTVNTSTNSSNLNIGGNCTLSTNGITWFNIANAVTSTITLTNDLVWSNNWAVSAGTITFSGVGNLAPTTTANLAFSGAPTVTLKNNIQVTNATVAGTINTNQVSVSGNLTVGAATSGTTNIILNGTGTWSSSAVYILNNITINTAGTITISGNIYYGTGSFIYTAGTVIATTATLNIASTSCTLSTGSIVWNTIILYNTLTITLGSNLNVNELRINYWISSTAATANITFSGSYTLNATTINLGNSRQVGSGSDLATIVAFPTTIVNNLNIYKNGYAMWQNGYSSSTYTVTLNSNSITVNNNFNLYTTRNGGDYLGQGGAYVTLSGNTEIIINGTTFNVSNASGSYVQLTVRPNITFNNSSSLTMSANVTDIVMTSNIVKDTNTGAISSNTPIYLNTCSIQLNNFNFNNYIYTTGTITLLSNANIYRLATYGTTNFSGVFNINVDNILNIAHTTTGNSTIIINGSGNKTWTSTAYLSTNLIIDAGSTNTLTLSSNIYYQTGTLSYTTGIVDTTTNLSTFNIGGTSNLSTNGITWFNITNANAGNINLLNNLSFTGTWSATSGLITYTGSGVLSPASTSRINFSGTSAVTTPDSVVGFTFSSINITTSGITTLRGNLLTSGLLTLGGSGNINSAAGLTGSITTTGGLSMAGNCSGTAFISLNGGTWSATGANYLNNNLVLNGDSGVSGSVYYQGGTMSYTSGNITTTNSTLNFGTSCIVNTGAMTWSSVSIIGSTPTITLTSGLNLTNNLTVSASSGTSNINGLFNVNVGGNLTITTACSGTSNILINGTGSQTWSSSAYLTNNLNINKSSGTLTLGANIYYNTGTLTYTNGTVDSLTNSSNLFIGGNVTLATSGITWHNINTSTTAAISLTNDFVWRNNWTVTAGTIAFSGTGSLAPLSTVNLAFSGTPNITIKNNIQVTNVTLTSSSTLTVNSNTINLSGNLLINGSAQAVTTGSTLLKFNGTGNQTWGIGANSTWLKNSITIDKTSGTLSLTSNIIYTTGTITYLQGDFNTSGGTLLLYSESITTPWTVRLDTKTVVWQSVYINVWSNATTTCTLDSDFNINNLNYFNLVGTLNFTINNGARFNPTGNVTVDLNTGNNGGLNFPNNVTINNLTTSGGINTGGTGALAIKGNSVITINGNVTINQICPFIRPYTLSDNISIILNGVNKNFSFSTLVLGINTTISSTASINFTNNYLYFFSKTFTIQPGATILNNNLFSFYVYTPTNAIDGTTSLDFNGYNFSGLYMYCSPQAATVNVTNMLSDVNTNTLGFYTSANTTQQLTTSNNSKIFTDSLVVNSTVTGTGIIEFVNKNRGTWTSTGYVLSIPTLNINGSNINSLTISGTVYYTGTLTYTKGKVIAKNSNFAVWGNSTLNNVHKIPFGTVTILSGSTITMNEFFSGDLNSSTTVTTSAAGVANVTFTDNFEKTAKFVKINNINFTRPSQLLLLTRRRINSTTDSNLNRYRIGNSMPNGISKSKPSVSELSTPGLSNLLLQNDPSFYKSI